MRSILLVSYSRSGDRVRDYKHLQGGEKMHSTLYSVPWWDIDQCVLDGIKGRNTGIHNIAATWVHPLEGSWGRRGGGMLCAGRILRSNCHLLLQENKSFLLTEQFRKVHYYFYYFYKHFHDQVVKGHIFQLFERSCKDDINITYN